MSGRFNFMFALVCCVCALSSWLCSFLYKKLSDSWDASGVILVNNFAWTCLLLLNLLGYATVLLPLYIMYKYLEKTRYFERLANPTSLSRVLTACFGDTSERLPDTARERGTVANEGVELLFCFSGLMGAYLVWGLLQEKIMTQDYVMSDGRRTKFYDSQFLVFINRLAAFLVASVRLMCSRQHKSRSAPLYKFSYCSLSNIVSAWCQYEALKYVSFPTQVLSKSCKIIPVMVMGRLVSGNRYRAYEYATAAMISAGMLAFMMGANDQTIASSVMMVSGNIILALYLLCDSFTSSWQANLFTTYKVSPIQMMCYVNLFSCLLPAAALLQNYRTINSISFLQNPVFLVDVCLLSLSSTIGQLLIYRTISAFGAVIFTIIMTLRQATSILLSCIVYGHSISSSGVFGITLVFSAVFLRMYCRHRIASKKQPPVKI